MAMEWVFALFLLIVNPDDQWFKAEANRLWIESGGYSDKTSCERVKADFMGSAERKKLKVISAKPCTERPPKSE